MIKKENTKKKLTTIPVFLLVFLLSFSFASAASPGGALPESDDPFWEVLDQINRPDDSTCAVKAEDILNSKGLPGGRDRAERTCEAISWIITTMQPALAAEGIETNLFGQDDWHEVKNLYFDSEDGRIEFTKDIDFMSYAFMNFLSNLTQRLNFEPEEIELDADIVGGLRDTGAILTMRNVSDFEEPEILVNGKKDKEGVVSNLVYDRASKTIVFNAAHFTVFQAVDANVVKASVKRVQAQKHTKWNNKGIVKFIIKGKNFKSDAEVKLGTKKAYRVKKINNRRIIAYFETKEINKLGVKNVYLKVKNPKAESDKFNKSFSVTSITKKLKTL